MSCGGAALSGKQKCKEFCDGKRTRNEEQWDEHEGMQAIQMHVENKVAHAKEEMGIQKTGRNEMPLRTFRLSHEGQSFLRILRQKGRILP
jgi:hypothetical protein